MKQKYIHKQLTKKTLALIEYCNDIIDIYQVQGYTLTLRQLYYQLVTHNLIPNNLSSYKKLSRVVRDGRDTGLINWQAIEDRTRNVYKIAHYNGIVDFINRIKHQYHTDLNKTQEYRIEVWYEKDAVSNIVEQVCNRYDIGYFATKGYPSLSSIYAAATGRFKYYKEKLLQDIIILHLADFDPSGVDMTRDIIERLAIYYKYEFNVIRIGLNYSQVIELQLPPNYVKVNDKRSEFFTANYGKQSWELDALNPQQLSELLEKNILNILNKNLFDIEVMNKTNDKLELNELIKNLV